LREGSGKIGRNMTEEDQPSKGKMGMISQGQFDILLPPACAWAEEQEQVILLEGVPLSSAQMADARKIGVLYPERVRVLNVTQIPVPEQPFLRTAAEATGFLSPSTLGLTLRYGIFVRSDFWGERRLVAHELVHTLQYERLGGFAPFLKRYLYECLTVGYPDAPMEQEAVMTAEKVCM